MAELQMDGKMQHYFQLYFPSLSAFMRLFVGLSFARFLVIGLLSAIVYVLLQYIFDEICQYNLATTNLFSFLFTFGASYYGHHRWSFKLRGNHRVHLIRFLALAWAIYLFVHIIAFLVPDVIENDHFLALGAITVTVLGISFLVSKFWVMSRNTPRNVDAASWMVLGVVASLLIATKVLTLLHGTSFNHDTSWYFVATRMWAAGEPLYSGVMEINPPLFFYLTRFVLAIGNFVNLSDEDTLRFVLFMLAGVSVTLMTKVLNAPAVSPPQRAAMMVIGTVALLMIPLGNFGQREHVFLIFVLPYIVSQAMRLAAHKVPVVLRMLCMGFAIPGLLLKPYFLLLPTLFTLYEALRVRSFAPILSLENIAIASASSLYLALIYIFHLDYFRIIVPLGQLVYSSYGRSIGDILYDPLLLLLLPCCLPLVVGGLSANDSRFAVALLVASIAFLAMFLIQFKGWDYHAIPYWSLTFLLAGWLLVSQVSTKFWVWAVIPFALVLKFVVLAQVDRGPYVSYATKQLQSSTKIEPGSAVMIYSTNVWLSFPFVNEAKVRWASRYPAQWIVPGAFVGLQRIPVEDIDGRAPYEAALGYARKTAVEDFVRHMPDLVIVDVRHIKSYFSGYPFDWINFLSQDPVFKQEWLAYYLEKSYPNIQIWRRRVY